MNDSLGDRMKAYENVSRFELPRQLPVMLRLDGKAFHTFTRGMDKPYDVRFMTAMQEAAIEVFKALDNARFAFVQSDEVSVVMLEATDRTQPYFGNNVQKIASTAASLMSVAFADAISGYAKSKRPVFDCRVWTLPQSEVVNYFIWRQQDATRNSLNTLAQCHFSSSQLHGMSQAQCHDMLHSIGVNWNDMPVSFRRGVTAFRQDEVVWADYNCPVFTSDRAYIERHMECRIR